MAEITLDSIAHSYASPPSPASYVLRDIMLRWRDGGAYALLGPSGCGKTTLLGIISGLVQPSEGRVLYGPNDVTTLPTRQRNIAQVFQFPVIYDTMTVFDNLAFPLRNRGVRPADIRTRVGRIAEMLELGHVLKRRATSLSADLKQIISLGRGLVRDDVAAILFDEPLTLIDPHRKWILRRKLREIHREFRHTLVYVTHDQTEALTFADEVAVMHEGRVLQQASPQDLFLRPAHTYVGYFIGSPGMNFVPCQVNPESGSAIVAGHALSLGALLRARAGGQGGDLVLGVRPEHLSILPPDASGQSDVPGLPGRIERIADHGAFCLVTAAVGEHRLKIKIKATELSGASAGESCMVALSPEHLCFYKEDRLLGDLSFGSTREVGNE